MISFAAIRSLVSSRIKNVATVRLCQEKALEVDCIFNSN